MDWVHLAGDCTHGETFMDTQQAVL